MGITTTYKKIFFPFSIFFFLLGIEFSGFSQCPTVSNSNQSFCDSQSPTVGSLVATDNGGGIRWYANASDSPGDFLSSSTSLVSGEDYFVDDNTGACGVRQSVTVSIVSRPIRLLAGTTLCQASVVSDLNSFVIGNNIKWYTTSTGGVALNQTDPISNGAYYASQTNPITGCETTRNVINVQILIVPPPTGNSNQVLCTSNSPTIADLIANGTNVSWYPSQSSGLPLDPSTPLINGQIYFAESYITPCPSISRLQVTVTLNQPNNAGGNRTIGFCESSISTQPTINLFNQLTGSPQANGVWSGPTLTSNGHLGTLDVSSFNSTSSPYIFTYTVSSSPCPDAVSTVTIIVNSNPTVTVTSPPVCAGTPATVTATPIPAGTYTYTWTVPAGATNPGNVSSFTTTTAGVYSVVITNPTTTCPSQAVQTTVVINPVPYAGIDGVLQICSNQNSVDLFDYLSGSPQTGGTWSPALASGTGIFNPAIDVSDVYVYTIAGIAPCVDDTATVTVTVIPGPEAGNNNSLIVCENSAPQDLFLLLGPNAQTGGTWLPALTSGTGIYDPSVDTAPFYTYMLTGSNPCDNDEATITITVNPVPDAGTDGAHLFCTNDAAQDLFDFLNGTPQTGGTWSPALASGTGVFNPLLDTADVYTYTVGGGNCDVATAQVTVTVVQSPIAGADGQLQACADDTAIDLTSGLDGTQGLGTFADDNATGALSGTTFNPSLVTPGTYTFTYTVSGGTSPCITDTAIVTVVVNPLPISGTFVPIAPICASSGTLDLNTLITGQDLGGTWSNTNGTVTSPIDISAFTEGTYTYDYTVTNTCDTAVTTVEFTILPIPTIVTTNVTVSPICIGADAIVTLSGMIDGTYDLNYELSGSNVLANQSVQITVVGGNASFTIAAADIPNSGTTIITFTGIGNTITNCEATPSNVTGSIVINPLVTIDDTNVSVANACLNSDVVVVISSAANLTDGTYQFDYSISGGVVLSGNSGDFVVTSGSGQFSIPATTFPAVGNYTIQINSITSTTQCSNLTINATANFEIVEPIVAGTFSGIISVCPSTGTIDLASLLDDENAGGVWTDATNQTVTSPLNIISFAPGTYSYTYTVSNACGNDDETIQFTILANPQIATPNIIIAPACLGTDVVVTLNGMTDGTYTLTYDLSGSNTVAAQTATVTIASGTGNFTIPTASLSNTGITVISFTNIVNTVTNCSNTVVNVTAQINVRPKADIESSNVSVASVCFGDNVVVTISNAANLPDGVYQFDYAISGGVVLSGNSGDVTITAGSGQFQLNSTLFSTAGNYTITINSITSTTLCPNTTENATVSFVINSAPNTAGANLSALATCANFSTEVTISNATGLTDGSYTIIYDLSGANIASATVVINVVSGVATFTIPATSILNDGDTTITITDIMSDSTLCTATGALFTPFTFSVTDLGTPVLIDKGNEFCDTDNPTIADLSANIVGNQTVIWYDAASGGTAYNDTDVLINGTTYYAVLVSQSGCESATRLNVTVDTTVCADLIIPDGFSPNGDGINDDFHIVNLEVLYPNFKLEVYNRYGNLIYTGNKNTPRWNGTTTEKSLRLGSNLLPSGVYFFIIYFNDGTRKPLQDRVYLNR
jgi:mucin-2